MTVESGLIKNIEIKVTEQLRGQRVGYLLGAGSSYLSNTGYPLAHELWGLIKDRITHLKQRDEIQAKLDGGATSLEHALDLLDDGGAKDTPYRHTVISAIADLFLSKQPTLNVHEVFLGRLIQRDDPFVNIFSLNYDPLLERAAENSGVRLIDGFIGFEHAFFDPNVFEERIGRIRGTHRGRQFDETVKPIRLFKLHGSLGWYECQQLGIRRCSYSLEPPSGTKRLMIPPQRRKANDTMLPPYSALWSAFRGCLGHYANPINRLACFGYAFSDEHVNSVIEAALARKDFTLLIFTKELSDVAWHRWSEKNNVIIVTETRCSLKGNISLGHPYLWCFENIATEV